MKRRVVTEDICALKFVGDPQISPDGQKVAYTLTETKVEKNGYATAVWIKDGEEERRYTFGQRADGGLVRDFAPRWSPCGRLLTFVSNRNGRPQLFLLEQGGEARQLTFMPEGIGEPVWSPDGRYIAFTSKDPRDEEAEKAKNPDLKHIRKLRYKFNGIGFLDDRRRHLYYLDMESETVHQVTKGEFDVSGISWSHDSRRFAFSAAISECELVQIPDIWVIDRDGSNMTRLTEGAGTATNPVFGPEGRGLVFFGHVKGQVGYANTDLWWMPELGEKPVNLTEAMDLSMGNSVGADARMDGGASTATWSADGKSVFVTITAGGVCHLYRVAVEDKRVERLTAGDISITSFSYANVNGEDQFAFVAGNMENPGDVYTLCGEKVEQLTRVNAAELAEWEMTVPERIACISAEGWEVEGWVLPPVGVKEGEKYPLILHIHGGPHATYGHGFMHEFHMLASAGYGVVYANPRGSKGYGEHFTKGVVGDWGGNDYADLMAIVNHTIENFAWVDEKRLGVTGGSYGGYMTNWIVTQTDRFKAAITLRSICNMYTKYGVSDIGWYGNKAGFAGKDLWDSEDFIMERSPIRHAPKVKTPTLIIHSEEDHRCPMEQAEQWYVALKRLGVTTELVRFAGENHELSRSGKPRNRVDRLNFILDWFERYL